MVAVSKLLTGFVAIGSTIALPLRIYSPLSEHSNSVPALSRRSVESTETPDTMWGSPGDRIRRSDDFTETPDTMWDQPGEDRIRRSMELMRIPDALEISPEDLFGAPFLWLKEGGRID